MVQSFNKFTYYGIFMLPIKLKISDSLNNYLLILTLSHNLLKDLSFISIFGNSLYIQIKRFTKNAK